MSTTLTFTRLPSAKLYDKCSFKCYQFSYLLTFLKILYTIFYTCQDHFIYFLINVPVLQNVQSKNKTNIAMAYTILIIFVGMIGLEPTTGRTQNGYSTIKLHPVDWGSRNRTYIFELKIQHPNPLDDAPLRYQIKFY